MNQPETQLIIRQLGQQDYVPIWQAMQKFTDQRDPNTLDEIWFVEHNPIFTQGLAGKAEHLLNPGDIPVIQVDRGGQITYHGPGQQVIYFLINLKRKKLGVRQLVSIIEEIIIAFLAGYGISAYAKADAPGVYVDNKKICSLGLKIRKGASFHGLALNVCMNKEPFKRINPCGYAGLEITQVADVGGPDQLSQVAEELIPFIMKQLNYLTEQSTDKSVVFDL